MASGAVPAGGRGELLSTAHATITFAITLTLLAKLLLVEASEAQFSTLASITPAILVAMVVVVAFARVYLDTSRSDLESL
jgi:hypothetical protein